MVEHDVLYARDDGIGIITLNRAERLNALTHEMLHRINSLIEDIIQFSGPTFKKRSVSFFNLCIASPI